MSLALTPDQLGTIVAATVRALSPEQLRLLVGVDSQPVVDHPGQKLGVSIALVDRDVAAAQEFSDTRIASGIGSSPNPEEEPMYKWIASRPYQHHDKWRVWYRGIDGKKGYQTFTDEQQAEEFVSKGKRRKIAGGGHAVGDVIEEYLAGRQSTLRASSITTLKFRLGAVIQGRREIPVEAFPWARAWAEHVAAQSADSQHGIRSALGGLFDYCVERGLLRKPPADDLQVRGRKRRGKVQLRIDEARRFVAEALRQGDPLALACATMMLTGLRPGEVMALQVRDFDDDGRVIWVARGKTEASRRTFEVAEELRPHLQALVQEKGGGPSARYLFDFTVVRVRETKNAGKRRTDALSRRMSSLCRQAGVPRVVPHSMRGLHSTLAVGFGVTGHAVAKQLGHTSFSVTRRHYVAPGALEAATLRSNLEVIRPGRGDSGQQGLRGNYSSKSVTAAKNAA